MNFFKYFIVFIFLNGFFLPAQSSQQDSLDKLFVELKKSYRKARRPNLQQQQQNLVDINFK